jgi:streptogramin lyase
MTTNSQSKPGGVAQPLLQQELFLRLDGEGSQGRSRKLHRQKMMLILAIVASVLFLYIQPVAAAPTITEFHVSDVGVPQGIAAGPDGNLWFTEFYDNVVGRITPQGKSTLFRLNTVNSATYITNGPDGALWVTLLNDVGGSTTNQIGRLTTGGKLTTFTVPHASYIWDITTGPNGKLYFTDGASKVWSITTKGKFTAFPFNDKTGGYPYQITSGPDGNLWFTDRARLIVKMTPAGKFTTFQVPTQDGSTDDIAAGPDGNLWFTLDGTGPSRIGRITPSGTITLFTISGSGNDGLSLSGIAAGPDGNLWFTYEDFSTNADEIGRITTSGSTSLFPTPTANGGPTDITAGPDGAMWFTEAVGNVGRITTN